MERPADAGRSEEDGLNPGSGLALSVPCGDTSPEGRGKNAPDHGLIMHSLPETGGFFVPSCRKVSKWTVVMEPKMRYTEEKSIGKKKV